MFSFLKNHPFAVEAFFESSLVVTYAMPKEQIEHLIPECLELDTFDDRWAFIAVAMVQTKSLRPKGFPKIFGNDFFLIGYRVFVRFTEKKGNRLRGLYILKSETDKKRMEFFGNIFTHYNYTTTDINQINKGAMTEIGSSQSRFEVLFEEADSENISLPANSPFTDWKEARRFAGPLPFTFTFNAINKTVLIIEGVRQHWKPKPVKVLEHSFSFIEELNLNDVRLANSFIIRNVPYYWKKGRIEHWTKPQ
jgi:uncharacterized protein YqjF (DUF2071 family)